MTKEPTCEEVGVKLYICSLCGDGYTENIPKTAHEDTDNDGKCDISEQQMTSGDHFKYCGQIHGGAFSWLIKFFYSIFAVFKRQHTYRRKAAGKESIYGIFGKTR